MSVIGIIGGAGARRWAAAVVAALVVSGPAEAAARGRVRARPAARDAAAEARPRPVGRTMLDAFDPDAIRFGWQGAGVVAAVRGRRIAARLASADGRQIYFHVVVDGKVLPRVATSSRAGEELVLAEDLTEGRHVVELYRDTESHQGASSFQGFTDGVVLATPPSGGRLLEIVGDSISAGYGVLGQETHGPGRDAGECPWAASSSSWAMTFGALAGHALGAEVSTIAMSGWGLYEGGQDEPDHAMGRVYGRAYGAYHDAAWTFPAAPQAVVVQLGGNDLGPREHPTFDPRRFVEAGLELVSQIRAHAPDAWIFLALPLDHEDQGTSTLREAQQGIVDARGRAGDERIERVELPVAPRPGDGVVVTGCQGHPSLANHRQMAEALRQRLHARLGW